MKNIQPGPAHTPCGTGMHTGLPFYRMVKRVKGGYAKLVTTTKANRMVNGTSSINPFTNQLETKFSSVLYKFA